MPSTCVFEFDRPEPIYYSGEIVNGRIILTTTNEKSCREIYIEFNGKAKVSWNEYKSRRRMRRTHTYAKHYRGYETYIECRTSVFPEGKLPAGTHVYEFRTPLPADAPSSCFEAYGHISYEISLYIDRPFRFDNIFRQAITVLKPLNLNMFPEYAIPLQGEDISQFCCWPCRSGPVLSKVEIPFGGYAPGQNIEYKLCVDNQSPSYDLKGLYLQLTQTFIFTAQTPRPKTKSLCVTLAAISNNDSVKRLTKRILTGELLIPPVPPTTKDSNIINIKYHLIMSIGLNVCHSESKIKLPLIIGTVPLYQSASNPEHVASVMPTAPTPDTPGYDSDAPPSYSLLKPPSFEAATTITNKFIDDDIDEHSRIEGFVPKYPMYLNFAIPSTPPTLASSSDASDAPLLVDPPSGQAAITENSPSAPQISADPRDDLGAVAPQS